MALAYTNDGDYVIVEPQININVNHVRKLPHCLTSGMLYWYENGMLMGQRPGAQMVSQFHRPELDFEVVDMVVLQWTMYCIGVGNVMIFDIQYDDTPKVRGKYAIPDGVETCVHRTNYGIHYVIIDGQCYQLVDGQTVPVYGRVNLRSDRWSSICPAVDIWWTGQEIQVEYDALKIKIGDIWVCNHGSANCCVIVDRFGRVSLCDIKFDVIRDIESNGKSIMIHTADKTIVGRVGYYISVEFDGTLNPQNSTKRAK